MPKKLVFLEDEIQVRNFIINNDAKNFEIIALSPFAMYELDKNKINYEFPDDFYDNFKLYELGISNYKKTEDICKLMDKYILEYYPIVKEYNITPAFFSFYYIKILYDSVTIKLYQLMQIIKYKKPELIIAYNDNFSETENHILFSNYESIYSKLLQLNSSINVDLLPYPEPFISKKSYSKVSFANKINFFLKNNPALFDLASKIKKEGLKSFFTNANIPMIIFGGGYNWDICSATFGKESLGPIIRVSDDPAYWENELEKDELLDGLWEKIKLDPKFRSHFIFENIDFFPVIEPKLKYFIQKAPLICVNTYSKTKKLIKKSGTKAILFSVLSTPISKCAAVAAHNCGIPVINWQHGAYGYMNQPMMPYNDMYEVDNLFVFGEGVKRKYDNETGKKTKIIPIGSAHLDELGKIIKLSQKAKSKIEKSLYVTTNFYQNNLYVAMPPFFSDNLFWLTQKKIADVLGKNKSQNHTIKIHDNINYKQTPLVAYSSNMQYKNLNFIRTKPTFSELIPNTDLIIIDWPSTTLLQSLTSNKPIFVFGGHFKIDENAKKLLKRRVYFSEDLDLFTNQLDEFLKNGSVKNYKIDLKNHDFLKEYGTYLDDMSSTKRAVDFLKNLTDKRTQSF